MWIVLDCDLAEHGKIAALPDNEARWGWIRTLLAAKRQRRAGRFASEEHLAYILGEELSAYIAEYIKLRLLDKSRGQLVVHDWADYQRDPTNAERQARYRARHRNVTSTGDVTDTSVTSNALHRQGHRHRQGERESVGGTLTVRESLRRARAREGTDPQSVEGFATPGEVDWQGEESRELDAEESAIFTRLAQLGAYLRPDSGYGRRILGVIERQGHAAVLAQIETMAADGKRRSDRQWTFGIENALERPESAADAVQAERQQQAARRDDRILEQMQRRRLEQWRHGIWHDEWGPPPAASVAADGSS